MSRALPFHIGVILDGNRRWAKKRGLASFEGHRQGLKNLERLASWCLEKEIKILTVYAFSAENWKRSPSEVKFLMGLVKKALKEEISKIEKKGCQIRFIGKRENLPFRKEIEKAEKRTSKNSRLIFQIAFNYGGREEIAEAFRKIAEKKIDPGEITQELISRHLWTKGLPDPDLIIRPGGEKRLSGFLTWQSVYSELWFSGKYWPEFSKNDFEKALQDFSLRKRNFGR